MAGAPEKCPTCSTAIPPGAVRCPGCGRVFGEDNRCPHCHAIAAVKPKGDGFACVACGKPREHLPGTTVLGDEDSRSSRASLVPGAPIAKAATSGLRLFGVLGVAGGVIGAALATIVLGTAPLGLAVAAAFALIGVATGVSALRRAARRDEKQTDRERLALEQRLVALAEKNGGDLTPAKVAESLRVTTAEADAALTRMTDGMRVSLEVDESDGAVHYVFHEVQSALPKTRVAPAPEEDEPDDPVAEAKKKSRRL